MQDSRSGLRTAWGEWLSEWPWDWWATLTFRGEGYSHAAASRAFERFARRLQRDSPSLGYFVGHEVGNLGRLHLHALLGGLSPFTSRRAAWGFWFEKHGRAHILPYDPRLGATHYVAKYVTKDLSHYDIQEPRPLGESLLAPLDMLRSETVQRLANEREERK